MIAFSEFHPDTMEVLWRPVDLGLTTNNVMGMVTPNPLGQQTRPFIENARPSSRARRVTITEITDESSEEEDWDMLDCKDEKDEKAHDDFFDEKEAFEILDGITKVYV